MGGLRWPRTGRRGLGLPAMFWGRAETGLHAPHHISESEPAVRGCEQAPPIAGMQFARASFGVGPLLAVDGSEHGVTSESLHRGVQANGLPACLFKTEHPN